ncbi:Holliday junction DNA helicase subunit RuvA [Ligilactobacillus sp. WC1T17]|uniref:Holliday junction branch migration complex subunit RuvA n=1 Tax=Ligilactobacillus ruminis TaxID=1623 RepID=A0ABY1AAI6_9LACO|nr:Holliday junction DNA helicase subunit RuvA [Ligilactobacillus ruminis]
MYEYLIGAVVDVTPQYIVVENNQLGYLIYTANPYRFTADPNKKEKIYLEQIVRENEITLYGFRSAKEKKLFLKLLEVSGIGPKSALAILANEDHQGFVLAVNNEDDGYLTKFPGIGKKTAKQIILDLKGKLTDLDSPEALIGQQGLTLTATADPYQKEAVAALLALGYTKQEVKRVAKKLQDYTADSTDGYLRYALKMMMK